MQPNSLGVELKGALASEYASLRWIYDDLCHANNALILYRDRPADRTDTVARALWESALISYRRCFEDGGQLLKGENRVKLRFDEVPRDHFVTHMNLWESANHQVAHEVARRVNTIVRPIEDPVEVARHGPIYCAGWQAIGPSDEQLVREVALLVALGDHVAARMTALGITLLADG